jgi:ABC-type phosphate transport system permease subunit
VLLDFLARVPYALPVLFALQPAEDAVRYFSVKDPEPDPERTLAWFVLNAFYLIAVALVVTLGLGIAFGTFRVWLLEKYPHNRFNGVPEDDPGETFRLRDTRD